MTKKTTKEALEHVEYWTTRFNDSYATKEQRLFIANKLNEALLEYDHLMREELT